MAGNSLLAKNARYGFRALMIAGERKKTWTPAESRAFTRACNALQVLSGHKFRMKMTKGGPRPYLPRRKKA